MKGLLDGIKILDLTRLLPGAFCTALLADYGAEVIKVESVDEGDYARNMGYQAGGQSVAFMQLNRNKKSLAINLKSVEGLAILKQLVTKSDVLIEGFRPGVAGKLGVDYGIVSEINPQVIYCSLSGYGQNGPYWDRAGHDINYLSIAGILNLNGPRNSSPQLPVLQIADIGGGALFAAAGILMALLSRYRTGEGQYLDISMLDGLISWQVLYLSEFLFTGTVPERGEYLLSGAAACYNIYQTSDRKYLGIGVVEPKFWREFCDIIGKPEWYDQQYVTGKEQDELIKNVQGIIAGKTCREWVEIFKDRDVCCEALLTLDEAVNHPQVRQRKMILEVEHPSLGTVRQIGFPIKFSRAGGRVRSPSPFLGEHTAEIMQEIGFNADQIDALHRKQVVKVHHR